MSFLIARHAKRQHFMIGRIRSQMQTIEQCSINSIVLYTFDILCYQSFFRFCKMLVK